MVAIREKKLIGDMPHRVSIERRVIERQDDGSMLPTWQPVQSCWAKVEPLKGSEFWFAQQTSTEISHKVTMRFIVGCSTKDRLVFRGRILHIKQVRNIDEKNLVTQLMCREVVG